MSVFIDSSEIGPWETQNNEYAKTFYQFNKVQNKLNQTKINNKLKIKSELKNIDQSNNTILKYNDCQDHRQKQFPQVIRQNRNQSMPNIQQSNQDNINSKNINTNSKINHRYPQQLSNQTSSTYSVINDSSIQSNYSTKYNPLLISECNTTKNGIQFYKVINSTSDQNNNFNPYQTSISKEKQIQKQNTLQAIPQIYYPSNIISDQEQYNNDINKRQFQYDSKPYLKRQDLKNRSTQNLYYGERKQKIQHFHQDNLINKSSIPIDNNYSFTPSSNLSSFYKIPKNLHTQSQHTSSSTLSPGNTLYFSMGQSKDKTKNQIKIKKIEQDLVKLYSGIQDTQSEINDQKLQKINETNKFKQFSQQHILDLLQDELVLQNEENTKQYEKQNDTQKSTQTIFKDYYIQDYNSQHSNILNKLNKKQKDIKQLYEQNEQSKNKQFHQLNVIEDEMKKEGFLKQYCLKQQYQQQKQSENKQTSQIIAKTISSTSNNTNSSMNNILTENEDYYQFFQPKIIHKGAKGFKLKQQSCLSKQQQHISDISSIEDNFKSNINKSICNKDKNQNYKQQKLSSLSILQDISLPQNKLENINFQNINQIFNQKNGQNIDKENNNQVKENIKQIKQQKQSQSYSQNYSMIQQLVLYNENKEIIKLPQYVSPDVSLKSPRLSQIQSTLKYNAFKYNMKLIGGKQYKGFINQE